MNLNSHALANPKVIKWLPIIFILFSVGIRFFSMFHSVLDHDESTYAVMGMEMLRSKLLYVDLIDIKPVGIYLIFAGIVSVSKSIFMIRLVGAIFVGLSAYQLFKIKGHFTKNDTLKILVGFTYIILISLDPIFKSKPFGLASNTEIFFCFFTLASINLLLKSDLKLKPSFIAGLILGLGVIIKYIVLIEACGIFTFFLICYFLDKKTKLVTILTSGSIYLVGALIPLLLSHLYYYSINEYEAIHYITFEATTKYQSNFSWSNQMSFILGNHQLGITMTLFYLAIIGKYISSEKVKYEKLFILVWLLFTILGVISTGNPFNHYRIQMLSVMAFTIPNFAFKTQWIHNLIKEKNRSRIAFTFVALNFAFYSVRYYQLYYSAKDEEQIISSYINSIKEDKDLIFNRTRGRQVIHLLTELSSPTGMIHSNNLGDEKRELVFNINRQKECDAIYSQKPRFILGKDDICSELNPSFIKDYKLDTTLQNIELYIYSK